MGMREDGVHVWGVVSPVLTGDGDEQIMVVEATSWASYVDDDGSHLVLSDAYGKVVERFGPGEWVDVRRDVPGVDVPDDKEARE